MRKSPLLILGVIAALAAVVFIGSCSWEMPEEVVFRAQPQLWIPTGNAVFDLDISQEITDGFIQSVTDAGLNLTAGEKQEGEDGYEGKPLTLYAELEIEAPTFEDPPPVPDFEVLLEGMTDPIDLSGVSGPIPEEVELREVPGWAWYDPGSTAPADPVYVRLEARWTDGGAQARYLLGTAGTGTGNFVTLAFSRASADTFDLTDVFNARPADLVLYYEFGVMSEDTDKVDRLYLRLEVPFAFDVTAPAPLDFEEDEENPLAMEEDIFGRDPAEPDEDLDRLLESVRGSSAGIIMKPTHTTGLGAHLGMINSADPVFADPLLGPEAKKNRDNWVVDVGISPEETEQEIDVGISAQVLDQMIDGAGGNRQFIPEFLILLEEDFQINSNWQITVTEGYLRVQAVIDYNFSLEDDE